MTHFLESWNEKVKANLEKRESMTPLLSVIRPSSPIKVEKGVEEERKELVGA
jgi:hypothetical protein